MGWLDANEYLLMEAMARDRVDDLRASVDLEHRGRADLCGLRTDDGADHR